MNQTEETDTTKHTTKWTPSTKKIFYKIDFQKKSGMNQTEETDTTKHTTEWSRSTKKNLQN